MAHKAVERIEPPFRDNEDGRVAYVMVYVNLNDTVKSVAFDDYGRELRKVNKDIRADLQPDQLPSVKF